ncbi:hypothetical protein J2S06_002788 [Bacillus alveayuensis]|uniref:Uncharacterized protein n=1 Tax=Aeribacillus alveayuensis TaxID=279215 RepID=A0ABT9VRR2_9BACI|nr:hypothetical protein [Bacillus alveayuensis]
MFPNLRGIAKQGKMMKHRAKGLSLLSQKLEEYFSLNYSFKQSLRQEIKSISFIFDRNDTFLICSGLGQVQRLAIYLILTNR